LDDASAPPTTTLHVRPSRGIGIGSVIHCLPALLPLVVGAVLWRIGPDVVADTIEVPVSRLGVKALRPTLEGAGCTPPSRIRHSCDGHLRIDGTLHVLLTRGTVVVLVRLAKLSARVGYRIHFLWPYSVPAVLVASVVSYRLLHSLCKEGSDVDQAVHVTMSAISTHVQLFAGDSLAVHHVQSVHEVVEAVYAAGHPLHEGGFVQEQLVVELVLHGTKCLLDRLHAHGGYR